MAMALTAVLIAVLIAAAAAAEGGVSNHIPGSSRGIATGDELVAHVVDSCFDGHEGMMRCVRKHALSYLDTLTGSEADAEEGAAEGRAQDEDQRLDQLILDRTQRYLRTHQLRVQLEEGVLTVKGDGSFDLAPPPPSHQPQGRADAEARDMMQNKMLLPILLLLKLKLKALTPILLALVGMKALKALILSKISILLVVGFLASQLFKKAGMMPMMPSMTMEPAMAPMTAYGPPTSSYGPPTPAVAPPPVTQSSYEPSWEPSAAGGPYQRWDAQQAAYSAYLPPPPPQPHAQQPASQQ